MGLFKYSGGSHIRKKRTTAEVFASAGGASAAGTAQIFENAANIIQLSKDLYVSPSLDGDGAPNLSSALEAAMLPVGSVIPLYSYGTALPTLPGTWQFCDGSAIADAGSPFNGQNTPDASGRYLVGFSDSSANEGNATLATTGALGVTGNAGHLATLASHNHTMGTHSHGPNTLRFQTMYAGSSTQLMGYDSGGTQQQILRGTPDGSTASTGSAHCWIYPQVSQFYTGTGSGTTTPVDPGDTTGVTGASSQDVRPRSIQVRHIMRIK